LYTLKTVSTKCGNKAGFITLKALFWILFLTASSYGAYKFAPPYLGFFMLRIDVGEEAKVAHMYTDEQLTGMIIKKADVWSIPLSGENILIQRGQEEIRIAVSYSVVLNFFDRYEQELFYDIDVEKPLNEGRSTRF